MARPLVSIGDADTRRLMRALKQLEGDVDKELKREMKDAAEVVASQARSNASAVSSRAARSIRGGATTKGGVVRGGKKAVPFYGWLDFGTRTPRRGQPRSVGPWANSGKGPKSGRFIYPAIEAKRDEYLALAEDAIYRAARKGRSAGLRIRR